MAYMLHANAAYQTRHGSMYTGSMVVLIYTDHVHIWQKH